jgi:hypothetical protein
MDLVAHPHPRTPGHPATIRRRHPGRPHPARLPLYDAFDLKIIYDRERHHATIRATITADTLDTLTSVINTTADRKPTGHQRNPGPAGQPAGGSVPVSHVLGAPGAARPASTPDARPPELTIRIETNVHGYAESRL